MRSTDNLSLPNRRRILILGGARSGKSTFAQKLASDMGQRVLFVATAAPLDEEMRQRIEAHKKARPRGWRTMEVATGVGNKLSRQIGDAEVVIIDCLTLLISNILGEASEVADSPLLNRRVMTQVKALIRCLEKSSASFIIVSNEVGMGLVPAYPSGRLFRDLLGKANQLVAEQADDVYLMVAGIPVEVKKLKSRGLSA